MDTSPKIVSTSIMYTSILPHYVDILIEVLWIAKVAVSGVLGSSLGVRGNVSEL